jgi:hypothetical protein
MLITLLSYENIDSNQPKHSDLIRFQGPSELVQAELTLDYRQRDRI